MSNTLNVYPIELLLLLPKRKIMNHCLINYLVMALLQRNIFLQTALATTDLIKISAHISFDSIGDYKLNTTLILHSKQTHKEKLIQWEMASLICLLPSPRLVSCKSQPVSSTASLSH